MNKNKPSIVISFVIWFIINMALITSSHALTSVEVARKALPTVVGIAVPEQFLGSYGFGKSSEKKGRLKELLQEYQRELKKFKKNTVPGKHIDPEQKIVPDELQVVGSGFFIEKMGHFLQQPMLLKMRARFMSSHMKINIIPQE